MSCPSIPVGEDASLSSVLAALDCQANAGVADAYARLFAPGGAFGDALTAALTIFVALLGLGMTTGRLPLRLQSLAPKLITFSLALTFATSWPAYQTIVFELAAHGPDQVAATLIGGDSSAFAAFTSKLDRLLGDVFTSAQALTAEPADENQSLALASKLTAASGLLLLVSTGGVLIAARLSLAVLLALGPVFVVLALFQPTRGLFEAWARTTAAMAFAPMLSTVGGGLLLHTLSPLIDSIAADPTSAAASMKPVIILFCGALIYVFTLAGLVWTAAALAGGWRIASPSPTAPHPSRSDNDATAASAIAVTSPAPSVELRTNDIIAGVMRTDVRPFIDYTSPSSAPSHTHRQALGKRFTRQAPPARLRGTRS